MVKDMDGVDEGQGGDEEESSYEEDSKPLSKKRKTEVVTQFCVIFGKRSCNFSCQCPKPVVGSVVAGEDEDSGVEEEGGGGDGISAAGRSEKETREEKKLAIMMMTGKRRKLYERIMRGKNRKARRVSGKKDSLYRQTWACLSNVPEVL